MKRSIGTRQEINTNSPIVITVKNLHKSFRLPKEKSSGLKQAIFNGLRGIRGYKDQKVLKGLNFEIKKGEFVAITGLSGIGKSTILKLLLGVIKPDKGSIYLSGKENTEITPSARELFAFVPQGNMVLSGTIKDNIRFFNEDRPAYSLSYLTPKQYREKYAA